MQVVKSMTVIAVGSISMLASGVSSAQNGDGIARNGVWTVGWMRGYGIYWGPMLIVVVGLVAWAFLRKRK